MSILTVMVRASSVENRTSGFPVRLDTERPVDQPHCAHVWCAYNICRVFEAIFTNVIAKHEDIIDGNRNTLI